MAVEVSRFREYRKNKMIGWATLLLTKAGIEIRDVSIFRDPEDGHIWVSMPSKMYENQQGEIRWYPLVWFPNPDRARKFQEEAAKAIEAYLKTMVSEPEPQSDYDDNDVPF